VFRRLRENGPVVLVPLAWTFVTAVHLDLVGTYPLLVAHLVMDTIILAFTVASWADMREGVLRAWKVVLVVGLGLTLAGTVGLLASPHVDVLLGVSLYGWMLLPAAGLAYTGRHVGDDEAPRVYLAGAVLSVVGAAVYAVAGAAGLGTVGVVVGLTLVNVGQTAGIVTAVYQY
jgi:hypothetical protein